MITSIDCFFYLHRHPFTPYKKGHDDEEDDDEADTPADVNEGVEILDDDEDEGVDAEEAINQCESEDDEREYESDNTLNTSRINNQSFDYSLPLAEENDYLSDNEEAVEKPHSSLDNESELGEMLDFLYELHDVVTQTRKLVDTIRSIAVIDQYIREFNDGPKNGFIIDMRVSYLRAIGGANEETVKGGNSKARRRCRVFIPIQSSIEAKRRSRLMYFHSRRGGIVPSIC